MVKTFEKQQSAMRAMEKFESMTAIQESKRIHEERTRKETNSRKNAERKLKL